MRAVLPRSRPGRWVIAAVAAAALAAGAVTAVAHPGPRPAGGVLLAARSSAAPGYCTGTALTRLPAVGGVTNIAGTEGGHLWWRGRAGGICIGTVITDIRSSILTGTETVQVLVYDDPHPGGQVVAARTIPAPEPGTYVFSFGVHRVFAGLTAVCIGALSCIEFSAP